MHIPVNVTNTFIITMTSIHKLTNMYVPVNITNTYITSITSIHNFTKIHVPVNVNMQEMRKSQVESFARTYNTLQLFIKL